MTDGRNDAAGAAHGVLWLGGCPLHSRAPDVSAFFGKYDFCEYIAPGEESCRMEPVQPGDSSRVAIVTMVTMEKAQAAKKAMAGACMWGCWEIEFQLQTDEWKRRAEKHPRWQARRGRDSTPQAVVVTRAAFEEDRYGLFATADWTNFFQKIEGAGATHGRTGGGDGGGTGAGAAEGSLPSEAPQGGSGYFGRVVNKEDGTTEQYDGYDELVAVWEMVRLRAKHGTWP